MGAHPPYYTDLVRRRRNGEPPLSPSQAREIDLHLLICPMCAYDLAQALAVVAPDAAARLRDEVAALLRGDRLLPYLRDLAHTLCAGDEPTGFQRLVWDAIQADDVALGRFRLIEADVERRARRQAL